MKIAISIWPETNAEWIELSLSSLPGVTVELVAQHISLKENAYDFLIVDAESPGPYFIQQLRQWSGKGPQIPTLFLGKSSSPAIARLPMERLLASYLPKPFKITDIREQVARQLKATPAQPTVAVQNSAPVSAHHREPSTRHSLNSLSTLRLSDLLQMLCLSQWTGKIEINRIPGGQHGCVYLNCGTPIHAESPLHTAEEACHDLLIWERCEFHFIEQHPPVVQTINDHWQMILLEAARLMDEDMAVAS